MKQYLYHRKPMDMTGTILRPLNQLKFTNPDLYEVKIKKYEGRAFLLDRPIPVLDCLWNDVLHMSPVDPVAWKAVLIEAGMPNKNKQFTFYKIDPATLDQAALAIYLFKELRRYRKEVSAEEFIPFTTDVLETITTIPLGTKQYLQETYESQQKPLLFFGIPHILYKGVIDITNLETITV